MIESYWNVKRLVPPMEIAHMGISSFRHRLGMSLTFDCIRCFKRELEQGRPAHFGNPAVAAPVGGTAGGGGGDGLVPGTTSLDALAAAATEPPPLADAFQRVDWNAFMEDFDWSFTPDYLNPQ